MVSYVPEPGSEVELARFAALQAQLESRYLRFRADPARPYTAVVVPSQSVDPEELAKIPGVAHYEQRSLFNLMLLRHPRLRLVFVTSKPLDPLIVDYYLHQMRGVPPAHARRRLVLLDCDDGSPLPLSQKILERPRVLQRIRDAIDDPDNAHLGVFVSTALERTLAVQLGIPLNACDPELAHLGTKTGSRRAFRDAGLKMPDGYEDLRDLSDLSEAVASLTARNPEARRVVLKLDESFSGEGNALLDLPGGSLEAAEVARRLPTARMAAPGVTYEGWSAQFDQMGGICELWLEGEGKRSPSAQLRITPSHEVQVISTHDQRLGGPGGQIFEGATFPARADYRLRIQEQSRRVGQVLASAGVIGRFGVDFLVRPDPDDPAAAPDVQAIEINLRQGGTTHPFNTMKFLTDGRYDETTGTFSTAQHQQRCYVATDTLASDAWRGLLPYDLLDRLVLEGIHFRSDETGVVFHLLGCLSEYGKLGCTAIGRDLAEAETLYERAVAMLQDLEGYEPPPAPGI